MEKEKEVDVAVALKMVCKTLKQLTAEVEILREDVDKMMENMGVINGKRD